MDPPTVTGMVGPVILSVLAHCLQIGMGMGAYFGSGGAGFEGVGRGGLAVVPNPGVIDLTTLRADPMTNGM
jgi:hypothetical protein